MSIIYEDTRQQVSHGDKHAAKHRWWASHGVTIERRKLDAGDYATDASNVLVDTKKGLAEICGNICGTKREHERVKREIQRAADAGCRLVFLIETVHAATIADVYAWTNDRCRRCARYRARSCDPRGKGGGCSVYSRRPVQGKQLAKTMSTMERRYGCAFEFARPADAGRVVCELLGVSVDDD